MVDETKDSFVSALQEYYNSYLVDTVNGSFQVFQSFTYGEMAICLLLVAILFTMVFQWLWMVIR